MPRCPQVYKRCAPGTSQPHNRSATNWSYSIRYISELPPSCSANKQLRQQLLKLHLLNRSFANCALISNTLLNPTRPWHSWLLPNSAGPSNTEGRRRLRNTAVAARFISNPVPIRACSSPALRRYTAELVRTEDRRPALHLALRILVSVQPIPAHTNAYAATLLLRRLLLSAARKVTGNGHSQQSLPPIRRICIRCRRWNTLISTAGVPGPLRRDGPRHPRHETRPCCSPIGAHRIRTGYSLLSQRTRCSMSKQRNQTISLPIPERLVTSPLERRIFVVRHRNGLVTYVFAHKLQASSFKQNVVSPR